MMKVYDYILAIITAETLLSLVMIAAAAQNPALLAITGVLAVAVLILWEAYCEHRADHA
jgi:hypothetical protein